MAPKFRPDMLTADQLEALLRSSKAAAEYARKAFGRKQAPAEIEAERRGDDGWAKRLQEMRQEEAKSRQQN